ncbi:MAG TPA: glucose 1-dehydrogenase [Dehalococcoidia bacterium]|nr:glucose 1-dehydrogenase [Dehalococcoidia bacterium]
MTDRVAVITGGASGMGEGTVRRFVDEGARVVIADLQDAKGNTLADTLGGAAVYQRTDVAEERDVRAAVERAVDEFGRLDVMFNNAGIGGAIGPIEDTSVEDYDRTMNVLLRGVFPGMKHAAPVMKRQGSGCVISTASVAGLSGGRGPHIYSAAKAAVINLTRSVAIELAEHNIRVNCICPGGIATPLLAGALGGTEEALALVRERLATLQPIPRSGMPDDIANAALWLASDEASFVTGQAIVIDGGLTAGQRWATMPDGMRTHRPMTRPAS